MNLKLNIYNKGEICKTYETDTCDILFGTVEDIINLIDLDKLDNNIEIAKIVINTIPQLKGLLKDIFIGLTDDEIKNTKVKELIPLFIEICKYSLTGILDTNEGK